MEIKNDSTVSNNDSENELIAQSGKVTQNASDENNKPKMPLPKRIKWLLNYIFVDGMGGMALGLFATLIAGTILAQLGKLINGQGAANNVLGVALEAIGKVAQLVMGAGIGIGVCLKFKTTAPLVVASTAAAAMVGGYAKQITELLMSDFSGGFSLSFASPGDPMGAFIGAITAHSVGRLVSGKTKIDILVTPLAALFAGSLVGILLGFPVSLALKKVGDFITWAANLGVAFSLLTGLIVSAVMGFCLTMPVSSAAIGISIGLSGVVAGAAVVGCCCHMVGFAVMSYRENGRSGLVAQGLGTSMLQIPNVFKKPVLLVPPVIASIILGTLSVILPNGTASLGLFATPAGSGMGTAGLVGVIDTVFEMIARGSNGWLIALWVPLFCIVLPAAITLAISELFRKLGIIKFGDLKLEL